MKTEKKTGENEISEVRAKFDDILVKEITRLIEVNDESIQAISFNMVTLSCLFLLVDRENDIKKISDNSIERYTKNSLLKEVLEVTGSGQTIDDSIDKGLLEAFEKLTQIGYVNIKNGSYYLQLPAFAVVNFINSLFPDMSGMNLVAFVNQMVDEVLTNRKGLDDGLEQFQKTLKARGVALNNLQKKDFNKQTPDKLPVQNKTDKKKQKNELMKQISSLRSVSKKQIGIPNIITSSYSKKVNIKEVFEKNGYQKNSEESVQNKKIEQVEQKNDVADLENKKADNKAEKLTNHDNILSPDSEENVVDSEKEENVVAPEFAKDIGNVDKPENILTPSVEKDIATQLHIKDEVARLVSEALKKQEIEKKVEIQKVEIQKEEIQKEEIQKVDEKNIEDKIDEDKIDIEKKIQMFENSIALLVLFVIKVKYLLRQLNQVKCIIPVQMKVVVLLAGANHILINALYVKIHF